MAPSGEGLSGSGWISTAVIGSCASVAVAGLGYLAYTSWYQSIDEVDDAPSTSTTKGNPSPPDANTVRMRIARGLQMQALAPTGPKRSAKPAKGTGSATVPGADGSPATAAADSKAPGASPAGSRKVCALCSKPTSGLPLRCSGCKQVYYCTKDCQRKAWPSHKASCKAASTPAAIEAGNPVVVEISSETSAPSATESNSGSVADTSVADTSATDSSQAEGEEKVHQNFQEQLAQYLEQAASEKEDLLEAGFERAVMLFVRAEYRASILQLLQVQELAKTRGDVGVQGEVYKWLGHAHNRLSEGSKAEKLFTEGAAYAKEHQLLKLEIDCLGGLGCMYRAQDKAPLAVELLGRALALAEAAEDEESVASTLCNLGAALMSVDSERALQCLHKAVDLREMAIERLSLSDEPVIRSQLATAVMEHANALINLASALMVTKRLLQAKVCFERALEVFELVSDVDKVSKVLVNLANLCELQMGGTPESRKEALSFRCRLLDFVKDQGMRRLETSCAICLEPMAMREETESEDKELIMLVCMHSLHNSCWNKHVEACKEGVSCPTCKAPVSVY